MGKNRITILDNEEYLRQVSKEVDFNDKSYINDIKELEDYCKNNAVWAMASVQIGIPKRIIYLRNTTSDMNKNFDSSYDEGKVFINPVILERTGHTRFLESCESCLDNAGVVDRPFLVIIEYYDINGQVKRETIRGFESTVLSHEYDHLNGVLHLDLINKNDVMQLNLEQRKIYREQHPYEVISETCDYDKIRAEKLKQKIK